MTLHNRRRTDSDFKKLPIIEAVYQLRFIWWLAGVFFIAFGFNFKTPAQHFKEIEFKADSSYNILNNRITSVERQHESIENYLASIIYSLCASKYTTMKQLPCDSLIKHK